MARLRFPGRPGCRADRVGIPFCADDVTESTDPTLLFITSLKKGNQEFKELCRESEGGGFQGFTEEDVRLSGKKLRAAIRAEHKLQGFHTPSGRVSDADQPSSSHGSQHRSSGPHSTPSSHQKAQSVHGIFGPVSAGGETPPLSREEILRKALAAKELLASLKAKHKHALQGRVVQNKVGRPRKPWKPAGKAVEKPLPSRSHPGTTAVNTNNEQKMKLLSKKAERKSASYQTPKMRLASTKQAASGQQLEKSTKIRLTDIKVSLLDVKKTASSETEGQVRVSKDRSKKVVKQLLQKAKQAGTRPLAKIKGAEHRPGSEGASQKRNVHTFVLPQFSRSRRAIIPNKRFIEDDPIPSAVLIKRPRIEVASPFTPDTLPSECKGDNESLTSCSSSSTTSGAKKGVKLKTPEQSSATRKKAVRSSVDGTSTASTVPASPSAHKRSQKSTPVAGSTSQSAAPFRLKSGKKLKAVQCRNTTPVGTGKKAGRRCSSSKEDESPQSFKSEPLDMTSANKSSTRTDVTPKSGKTDGTPRVSRTAISEGDRTEVAQSPRLSTRGDVTPSKTEASSSSSTVGRVEEQRSLDSVPSAEQLLQLEMSPVVAVTPHKVNPSELPPTSSDPLTATTSFRKGLLEQPLIVEGKRQRLPSLKLRLINRQSEESAAASESEGSDLTVGGEEIKQNGSKKEKFTLFPKAPASAPKKFNRAGPMKLQRRDKDGKESILMKRSGQIMLRKAKLQLNRTALNRSKAALARSLKAQLKREAKQKGRKSEPQRHSPRPGVTSPLSISVLGLSGAHPFESPNSQPSPLLAGLSPGSQGGFASPPRIVSSLSPISLPSKKEPGEGTGDKSRESSKPDSRGPRIKHVCRRAAVVLPKPLATFPAPPDPSESPTLSALPSPEKEKLLQSHTTNSDDDRDSSEEEKVKYKKKKIIPSAKFKRLQAKYGRLRGRRKNRCKECRGCLTPNCGKCVYCLDSKKFGGKNTLKKACVNRKCERPVYSKQATDAFIQPKTSNNEGDEVDSNQVRQGPSRTARPAAGFFASMGGDSRGEDAQDEGEGGPGERSPPPSFPGTAASGRERAIRAAPPSSSSRMGADGGVVMDEGGLEIMSAVGVQRHTLTHHARRLLKRKEKSGLRVRLPVVVPEPQPMVITSALWSLPPNTRSIVHTELKESFDLEVAWSRGLALTMAGPTCVRNVCFLCGSAGREKLLYCNICCEPFHWFCVEAEDRPLEGCPVDSWCCRRCQFCHVCGLQTGLLQCDRCQDTYHPECLGPAYPKQPSRRNVWVCTKCVRCKSCGATTPGSSTNATWTYDFSLCFDCGKLMDKGNFCPICRKCYTDDDWESKMVQCALCDSWVHARCEGLTDEMYQLFSFLPEDIQYRCRVCCPDDPPEWRTILRDELLSGLRSVLTGLTSFKCSHHLLVINEEKERERSQRALQRKKPALALGPSPTLSPVNAEATRTSPRHPRHSRSGHAPSPGEKQATSEADVEKDASPSKSAASPQCTSSSSSNRQEGGSLLREDASLSDVLPGEEEKEEESMEVSDGEVVSPDGEAVSPAKKSDTQTEPDRRRPDDGDDGGAATCKGEHPDKAVSSEEIVVEQLAEKPAGELSLSSLSSAPDPLDDGVEVKPDVVDLCNDGKEVGVSEGKEEFLGKKESDSKPSPALTPLAKDRAQDGVTTSPDGCGSVSSSSSSSATATASSPSLESTPSFIAMETTRSAAGSEGSGECWLESHNRMITTTTTTPLPTGVARNLFETFLASSGTGGKGTHGDGGDGDQLTDRWTLAHPDSRDSSCLPLLSRRLYCSSDMADVSFISCPANTSEAVENSWVDEDTSRHMKTDNKHEPSDSGTSATNYGGALPRQEEEGGRREGGGGGSGGSSLEVKGQGQGHHVTFTVNMVTEATLTTAAAVAGGNGGSRSLAQRFQRQFPRDFNAVRMKLESDRYSSVEEFNEDMVHIIQTALSDDHLLPTRRKHNNSVKSIFIKQMERVFPWFNVKTCQLWQHNRALPQGMLPDAVVPPYNDHTYAQWLERESTLSAPQLSPFKPFAMMSPTESAHSLGIVGQGFEDLRQCALCLDMGDGYPDEAGRLLYAGQDDWVHVNCALWSAEVFEEEDGTLQNVHVAMVRGRQLRCNRCLMQGATVGCCVQGCPANFHFLCARRHLCLFKEDKTVYCFEHRHQAGTQAENHKGFAVHRRMCVDMADIRCMKKSWARGLDAVNVNILFGCCTVESLGSLAPLSDCKGCLLPLDFRCTRVYWSTVNARRRTVYTCRIVEVRPAPPTPEPRLRDVRIVHDEFHPDFVPFDTLDLSSMGLTHLLSSSDDVVCISHTSPSKAVCQGQSTMSERGSIQQRKDETETISSRVSVAAASELASAVPACSVADDHSSVFHAPSVTSSESSQGGVSRLRAASVAAVSVSRPVADYSRLSASTLRLLNITDPTQVASLPQAAAVVSHPPSPTLQTDFGNLTGMVQRLNSAAQRSKSATGKVEAEGVAVRGQRCSSVDRVTTTGGVRDAAGVRRQKRSMSLSPVGFTRNRPEDWGRRSSRVLGAREKRGSSEPPTREIFVDLTVDDGDVNSAHEQTAGKSKDRVETHFRTAESVAGKESPGNETLTGAGAGKEVQGVESDEEEVAEVDSDMALAEHVLQNVPKEILESSEVKVVVVPDDVSEEEAVQLAEEALRHSDDQEDQITPLSREVHCEGSSASDEVPACSTEAEKDADSGATTGDKNCENRAADDETDVLSRTKSQMYTANRTQDVGKGRGDLTKGEDCSAESSKEDNHSATETGSFVAVGQLMMTSCQPDADSGTETRDTPIQKDVEETLEGHRPQNLSQPAAKILQDNDDTHKATVEQDAPSQDRSQDSITDSLKGSSVSKADQSQSSCQGASGCQEETYITSSLKMAEALNVALVYDRKGNIIGQRRHRPYVVETIQKKGDSLNIGIQRAVERGITGSGKLPFEHFRLALNTAAPKHSVAGGQEEKVEDGIRTEVPSVQAPHSTLDSVLGEDGAGDSGKGDGPSCARQVRDPAQTESVNEMGDGGNVAVGDQPGGVDSSEATQSIGVMKGAATTGAETSRRKLSCLVEDGAGSVTTEQVVVGRSRHHSNEDISLGIKLPEDVDTKRLHCSVSMHKLRLDDVNSSVSVKDVCERHGINNCSVTDCSQRDSTAIAIVPGEKHGVEEEKHGAERGKASVTEVRDNTGGERSSASEVQLGTEEEGKTTAVEIKDSGIEERKSSATEEKDGAEGKGSTDAAECGTETYTITSSVDGSAVTPSSQSETGQRRLCDPDPGGVGVGVKGQQQRWVEADTLCHKLGLPSPESSCLHSLMAAGGKRLCNGVEKEGSPPLASKDDLVALALHPPPSVTQNISESLRTVECRVSLERLAGGGSGGRDAAGGSGSLPHDPPHSNDGFPISSQRPSSADALKVSGETCAAAVLDSNCAESENGGDDASNGVSVPRSLHALKVGDSCPSFNNSFVEFLGKMESANQQGVPQGEDRKAGSAGTHSAQRAHGSEAGNAVMETDVDGSEPGRENSVQHSSDIVEQVKSPQADDSLPLHTELALRIKAESLARSSPGESGPFKCPTCKRLYRTVQSFSAHAESCDFDVSTSDEEEEGEEERREGEKEGGKEDGKQSLRTSLRQSTLTQRKAMESSQQQLAQQAAEKTTSLTSKGSKQPPTADKAMPLTSARTCKSPDDLSPYRTRGRPKRLLGSESQTSPHALEAGRRGRGRPRKMSGQAPTEDGTKEAERRVEQLSPKESLLGAVGLVSKNCLELQAAMAASRPPTSVLSEHHHSQHLSSPPSSPSSSDPASPASPASPPGGILCAAPPPGGSQSTAQTLTTAVPSSTQPPDTACSMADHRDLERIPCDTEPLPQQQQAAPEPSNTEVSGSDLLASQDRKTHDDAEDSDHDSDVIIIGEDPVGTVGVPGKTANRNNPPSSILKDVLGGAFRERMLGGASVHLKERGDVMKATQLLKTASDIAQRAGGATSEKHRAVSPILSRLGSALWHTPSLHDGVSGTQRAPLRVGGREAGSLSGQADMKPLHISVTHQPDTKTYVNKTTIQTDMKPLTVSVTQRTPDHISSTLVSSSLPSVTQSYSGASTATISLSTSSSPSHNYPSRSSLLLSSSNVQADIDSDDLSFTDSEDDESRMETDSSLPPLSTLTQGATTTMTSGVGMGVSAVRTSVPPPTGVISISSASSFAGTLVRSSNSCGTQPSGSAAATFLSSQPAVSASVSSCASSSGVARPPTPQQTAATHLLSMLDKLSPDQKLILTQQLFKKGALSIESPVTPHQPLTLSQGAGGPPPSQPLTLSQGVGVPRSQPLTLSQGVGVPRSQPLTLSQGAGGPHSAPKVVLGSGGQVMGEGGQSGFSVGAVQASLIPGTSTLRIVNTPSGGPGGQLTFVHPQQQHEAGGGVVAVTPTLMTQPGPQGSVQILQHRPGIVVQHPTVLPPFPTGMATSPLLPSLPVTTHHASSSTSPLGSGLLSVQGQPGGGMLTAPQAQVQASARVLPPPPPPPAQAPQPSHHPPPPPPAATVLCQAGAVVNTLTPQTLVPAPVGYMGSFLLDPSKGAGGAGEDKGRLQLLSIIQGAMVSQAGSAHTSSSIPALLTSGSGLAVSQGGGGGGGGAVVTVGGSGGAGGRMVSPAAVAAAAVAPPRVIRVVVDKSEHAFSASPSPSIVRIMQVTPSAPPPHPPTLPPPPPLPPSTPSSGVSPSPTLSQHSLLSSSSSIHPFSSSSSSSSSFSPSSSSVVHNGSGRTGGVGGGVILPDSLSSAVFIRKRQAYALQPSTPPPPTKRPKLVTLDRNGIMQVKDPSQLMSKSEGMSSAQGSMMTAAAATSSGGVGVSSCTASCQTSYKVATAAAAAGGVRREPKSVTLNNFKTLLKDKITARARKQNSSVSRDRDGAAKAKAKAKSGAPRLPGKGKARGKVKVKAKGGDAVPRKKRVTRRKGGPLSHPIVHLSHQAGAVLPQAEVEEEIRDTPLRQNPVMPPSQRPLEGRGAWPKDMPRLAFEITSEDGFSCRADTMEEAWRQVTDKVQDARAAARMKQLSYGGVNGVQMFGVGHDAVVYLVEQLAGAANCRQYKFRYHHYEPPEDEELYVNPSGCARCSPFSGRKPYDIFSFLMSRHRHRPCQDNNKSKEEEMEHKSSRRATSMELPMAMRFRKLQEHAKEAVGVYRSRIHGRGLFCKRNIDNGEMVIEYSGEIIRSSLTDKREKYYESKGIGCYMFRIDDCEVVDATMHGSAARFINHSCEPNCYSKVISVDGKKHIVIFANRAIKKGEELTYDYKFPIEDVKIPCTCGSRRCRKYLN
ncbi:uncharacterized protein LOC143277582 [Babylonia areolata]|uniref:uncharacterized protein LOC143277582 n=1 Tax=Babylonia areolata TaxID=304850 RepID=UPI003FD18420